ncbi:VCBS repeat-containing protein [Tamlana fucoidanivorans]|uniref:ASPIC/UnbV domain-containing protein n=1 Tax=Allotamlana fucoidanivorans TaxID=2583814 RepID=A0A5C4SP32_9FLAO|nr:VCBS repeat-containing protein [Tamlana fucoidanivorans]TNJ45630.1 hypothetical protein FGF67_04415 [Tamlana fucoidanivorans]
MNRENKQIISFLFLVALSIVIQSCKRDLPYPLLETDKHFTLVNSDYTNIKFSNTLTETAEENHIINENFVNGAGVAIGDINNDGLQDLYFSGNQVNDKLYLNKGNLVFEDISESSGINKFNSWSTGVTFADFNSDGLQDIYVCKNASKENSSTSNLLFINNGDLTFTEAGEVFRVNDIGFSIQANVIDYNKDGWPDIYLVNQPPSYGSRKTGQTPLKYKNPRFSDKLYRNLGGNKGFVEISGLAKTRNLAHGLSASAGDLNNDGWTDLYITNDYDKPDFLYINNADGSFKNTINHSFKHISNFSMGSDIADFDNDGNLDIMVVDMVAEDHKRIKTNMSGMNPENFWAIVNKGWHHQYMFNTLHKNNGNNSFSDIAQLAGVSNTDWSWGPLIADFDNDGLKDVFVTNGIRRNMRFSDINSKYEQILDSIEVVAKQQNKRFQDVVDVLTLAKMAPIDKLKNYAFKNNGDLTFENKIEDWGFSLKTLSNGASYADLDLDGDLDLIINNIDDEALIYRNNSVERNLGNFIRFKLKHENNMLIFGTRVSIFKNDSLWQMVEITNNRGYMSKSEDIAHFGIGSSTAIDKAVISWPNGKNTVLKKLDANQTIEVSSDHTNENYNISNQKNSLLFKDITKSISLSLKHQENNYNDYEKEILLPHKMSQFGPYISVGDANGDGLDDFYIGGSANHSGKLVLQKLSGIFEIQNIGGWSIDKNCEDAGSCFIDIDNDGDLDLFVASGGNEFEVNNPKYQDRLYVNDGNGNFKKDQTKVPDYRISCSVVEKADYDNDGDMDIFIGGRHTPQKYAFPTSSKLLENQNGKFVDVTNSTIPGLNNIGMVTSATWVDVNNDENLDLVVVGEWMPITIFINVNGKYKIQNYEGIDKSEGWYFEVKSADMDGDGDMDLVVGNLGLNYKYKASVNSPFQVHSYDFDKNGTQDIVLSYYDHGQVYPVRGKSCSTQQIPSLSEKFPTYESFGDSNLLDIYGNDLNNALNLKAYTFASYYIENIKGTSFKMHKLPMLAQISNINNILIEDFDSDGNKDILVSGNLYGSEIETPRNDAGIGLFLKGNGQGDFTPIPTLKSGFFTPHNAKSMEKITINNINAILIGNNNEAIQMISY